MAQPQKATPEKATSKRPAMVDFDSIESSTFDAKAETASVKAIDKAPRLLRMFKESLDSLSTENPIGHRFMVPTVNAKQTETLIRAAAKKYNAGATVGLLPKPGGMTEVSFQAKAKKEFTKPRKPVAIKRKQGESASDWRARQDKYNAALNAWTRAQGSARA